MITKRDLYLKKLYIYDHGVQRIKDSYDCRMTRCFAFMWGLTLFDWHYSGRLWKSGCYDIFACHAWSSLKLIFYFTFLLCAIIIIKDSSVIRLSNLYSITVRAIKKKRNVK